MRFSALGRRATLGLALLSLSACKAKRTQAPEPPLDDIAAIEAELAANADRLLAQGVRPSTSTAVDASAFDGGGAQAPAEPPGPVRPEPEPEPAPAAEDEESMAMDEPGSPGRRRVGASRAKDRNRREPTRCERICQLETSTCDLADRICALADEHVDDVRYEEACERAQTQCDAAADACSTCED